MPNAQAQHTVTIKSRQAEIIDAVILHGGKKPAARALNIAPHTVREAVHAVRKKAALHGHAQQVGGRRRWRRRHRADCT